MRRRPALGDDRGSALLFAVIVIFVVLTVVTSMLSLSSSNLRATAAYSDQAGTASSAEGAIQTAANTIRQTAFNNAPGQRCFPDASGSLTSASASDTMPLDDVAAQGGRHYSAQVRCTHSGGSSSPVLINAGNRPGMAILTTGDGSLVGEAGLSIKALNANPFRVHGVIYSNSTLKMVSGTLVDDQRVFARGACTNASSVTPPPNCGWTDPNPSGADPGYPQPTTVPAYQEVPYADARFPNSCKDKVIPFDPGYYDDAKSLSTLMSSAGCSGSTFWFKPGLYYFDFHNGNDPALASASHVWTVNSGSLVAGTPINASGGTIAAPPLNPTIPGSCLSPISSASAVGVQFVFGGDSQLVVDAAKAEVCGTYSTTSPPLALYGATSGTETQLVKTGLEMSTSLGYSAGSFNNVPGMGLTDSSAATWTNNSNGTKSTTATIHGFSSASAPVPGAHLDQAKLFITHSNSAGATNDERKVVVTLPNGSSFEKNLSSPNDNLSHTDEVDLTANSTFADYVHRHGLSELTLAYSVTVRHTGVETVDAISLDLKYRQPAYRSQALPVAGGNCLTQAYSGLGGGGCAAVTSTQDPGNRFYVQGTTYMPKAALDIALNQATSQVFKFGVVARSLQVKVTGSSTFNEPVIEVPDDAPGSIISTNVILSAYVCSGTSAATCPVTGTPALRSRIALIDPSPGAVVIGLRALDIQTWSEPPRSGG